MENTFLAKLNNYITSAFEKIAVIRTRQALITLDDHTLSDIGYTRQQVLNGDFYNVTDCLLYTSPSPRDMPRSRMPSSA